MALTVRTNGSGGSNIITASWFNDFLNLLTGVMTDQPVFLSYAPGSSGSTPTLKLKSNGNAPYLTAYKSDGTTVAGTLDYNGNLTLLNSLIASGALSWGAGVSGSLSKVTWDAANHGNVYWSPQSGATALGHVFVTWSGSTQVNPFSVGGQVAGALAYVDNTGQLFQGTKAYAVIVGSGATGGRQIFVGTTTPTGANEGDIWVKA